MKLKTPTLPRNGHHDRARGATTAWARPQEPVVSPVPASPADALRRAAGGLASPARTRNTAAMLAGLAFIVIAGAIGASVASSYDDSIDALVAASPINEGERITEDHFRTVRIAAAAGDIEILPPEAAAELVGRVAAGPIGEGAMVHPSQFDVAHSEQRILVGALLEPDEYPAGGLKRGDMVRLIAVAGSSLSGGDTEVPLREIAIGEIADVVQMSETAMHYSIRVPESASNIVVQLVAQNRLSLGLLDDSIELEGVEPLTPAEPVEPIELEDEEALSVIETSDLGDDPTQFSLEGSDG